MSDTTPPPFYHDEDKRPTLLLAGVHPFREIYFPLMEALSPSRFCEIGIEAGDTTWGLLDWCREHSCRYVGVDPSIDDELRAQIEERGGEVCLEMSLPALETIEPAQVYFVDGDHNYHTVSNELTAIHQRAANDKSLGIFLHDVAWPCARRDQYYNPDTIPQEAQNTYHTSLGAVPHHDGLVQGGFRGVGGFYWAQQEGGLKNGVFTAVEDFISAHSNEYLFLRIPTVFGFGILLRKQALPEAAEKLYHQFAEALTSFEPLIQRLERNRLELLVSTFELQDERASFILEKRFSDEKDMQLQNQRAELEKYHNSSLFELVGRWLKRKLKPSEENPGPQFTAPNIKIAEHLPQPEKSVIIIDLLGGLLIPDGSINTIHHKTAKRAEEIFQERGVSLTKEVFQRERSMLPDWDTIQQEEQGSRPEATPIVLYFRYLLKKLMPTEIIYGADALLAIFEWNTIIESSRASSELPQLSKFIQAGGKVVVPYFDKVTGDSETMTGDSLIAGLKLPDNISALSLAAHPEFNFPDCSFIVLYNNTGDEISQSTLFEILKVDDIPYLTSGLLVAEESTPIGELKYTPIYDKCLAAFCNAEPMA
jgi:hypothetical protein